MKRVIKGTKANGIKAFETKPIPIYGGRFGVLFTTRSVELSNCLINDTDQDTIDYAHFFYLEEKMKSGNKALFLIAFNLGHDANITRGTIAHEVNHAVNNILLDRGLYLTLESEEAYAYLTGYLTNETYNVIDKYNIKIK